MRSPSKIHPNQQDSRVAYSKTRLLSSLKPKHATATHISHSKMGRFQRTKFNNSKRTRKNATHASVYNSQKRSKNKSSFTTMMRGDTPSKRKVSINSHKESKDTERKSRNSIDTIEDLACPCIDVQSSERVLFTSNEEISHQSVLIVPFKATVSHDFPTSHHHRNNLSNLEKLHLQYLRKSTMHKGDSPSRESQSHSASVSQSRSEDSETVIQKNRITAYFVPTRDYLQKRKKQNVRDDEALPLSMYREFPYFIEDQSHLLVLPVGQSSDFRRFTSCITLDLVQSYINSVSGIFNGCFSCFKSKQSKVKPQPTENLQDIIISVDKLVYRSIDDGINCVVNYSNHILANWQYIDIVLSVKYRVRYSMIKGASQPSKRRKDGMFHVVNTDYKPQVSRVKSARSVSFVITNQNTLSKNNQRQRVPNNQAVLNPSGPTFEEDEKDPSVQVFDAVIFSDRIDLVGKRVIDKMKRSEIVHRVALGNREEFSSLETVHSKFVGVDYFLSFYLSKETYRYCQLLSRVPLKFTNSPKFHRSASQHSLKQMQSILQGKVDSMEWAFLLPFAKIQFDNQGTYS